MLEGIRVVDLTSVVLGPYATMMLADLGAEVIKVESLDGDVMRAAKPARSSAMGAVYLNSNRGKKSIALNLKDARAREILIDLCASAEVFVHSMRPKAIESLDLGYDVIKAASPAIVYCAAWGFDQRGPLANAPAYDDIIQGASGVAALNSDDSGAPRYLPTIIADKVTGLFTANAILAALYHRHATGEGQCIEVPMMECMASFMLVEHMAGAVFSPPQGEVGYTRMLARSRRPYRTKDGYMGVLPYSQAQWQRFLREVGRDDLAAADWVNDGAARSERIDDLYAVVAESMPDRLSVEWEATFQRIDIPHTVINSLDDLLDSPQLEAAEFFEDYDHPTEGKLRGNRPPVRHFVEREPSARAAPAAPALGHDTAEVLSSLGVSPDELAALEERGAIATDPRAD